MEKKIFKIFKEQKIQWVGDGFRVYHYIPTHDLTMQRMDPFIMLDYHPEYQYTPIPNQQVRGVGAHPHKGFETVTIVYQGALEHKDSAGNGGIIWAGDVQWMTAGAGILHTELHEKSFSEKGGILQLVQLWVNLPAKYKYVSPKYQSIENKQIKKVLLEDGLSYLEIIAGDYQGVDGAAETFSPIHLYNLYVENQAVVNLNLKNFFTTALLVIKGKIQIQNQIILQDHFVVFEKNGSNLEIKAEEQSIVLFMSGEPLNEPIVSYGPFVMNTQKEIYEAIQEYHDGKFGILD